MASRSEPTRDGRTPTVRGAASPAMLILLTLTVQVCVGGPAWAATVLRHEVAAQRDQARQAASVVRTLSAIVATSPCEESELVSDCETLDVPRARVPSFGELVGLVHETSLPPPGA